LQAKRLLHVVNSSIWDSGCSSCSDKRIRILEIRKNSKLRERFGKQERLCLFVDSLIWDFGRSSCSEKRNRNSEDFKTQEATWQARSASPLCGLFDLGFRTLGASGCSDEKNRNPTEPQKSGSDFASKISIANLWILRFGLLVVRTAVTKGVEIRKMFKLRKQYGK
jgi:hypothetical protein